MKINASILLVTLFSVTQTLSMALPKPLPATGFGIPPPKLAPELSSAHLAKRNSPTGYTTGTSLQKAMLKYHNAYRAHHGAGNVTWSKTLARAALAQARKCVFAHSDPYKYGENIAGGSSGYTNPAYFVYLWYQEVADYDFDNPGYSGDVGHFTQLVWKGTKQIGCAFAVGCTGDTEPRTDVLLVCEYSPNGNVLPDENFATNVGRPQRRPANPAPPNPTS